jgi:sodium/potassium-transporting ATPase subunit alpha
LETLSIGLMGTHCVMGNALGVAISTGDKSVFGQVLASTPAADETIDV